MLYVQHLRNLFSFMLFLAGILSITSFIISRFFYNLYTGLIFIAVAFINAGLEFYQEYQSAVILRGFMQLVPEKVLATRAGVNQQLSLDALVRGDIIRLKAGDKVPADARLVTTTDMRLDLSSLTGESEPVERYAATEDCILAESTNIAFSGALVTSGMGTGIVIRTGRDSFIGRIANLAVAARPTGSHLGRQIKVFVRYIVTIGITLGITYMVVGFSRGLPVTLNFEVAIGVFVSFLPQGLPATITLLLTIAAKRMAARGVLAKNVHAVETLGTITILATDKTGTLTQNVMAATRLWIDAHLVDAESLGGDELATASASALLIECAIGCTHARFDASQGGVDWQQRTIFADATEAGIIRFAARFTDPAEGVRRRRTLVEVPFSSATKYQLAVVKADDATKAYAKGAPERILSFCSTLLLNGEAQPMTEDFREQFRQAYEQMAGEGLRSVAFAYLQCSEGDDPDGLIVGEKFTFIGMLGLYDPPKEGVSEAIRACKRAGIRVVMITGDHPLTAAAIARQVDILEHPVSDDLHSPSPAIVLAGVDVIDSLTDAEWAVIVNRKTELVFARTLPRHKLTIVRRFQKAGHIVGVTGDGVNDAPALKIADLGISMNRSASDLSKGVAELIILDDRFATIVHGIFEGRLVFENLKKSVRYLLSHIMPVAIGLGVYVVTLIPIPITPLLVVVIDLLADVWPAVAFAYEPPEVDLMAMPPRNLTNVRTLPITDIPHDPTVNNAGFIPGDDPNVIERHTPPLKLELLALLKRVYGSSIKGTPLVNAEVIRWAFLQAGLFNTVGAFGSYIVGIALAGVPFAVLWNANLTYFTSTSPPLGLTNGTLASASDQVTINNKLATGYFLSIMIVQYYNVFLCKHRFRPPWGADLFFNRPMYAAIALSAAICSIVAFVPAIQDVFKTGYIWALQIAPPFAAGAALFAWTACKWGVRRRRKWASYSTANP